MQNPEMEDYVRIKDEMWTNLDQQLPVQKTTRLWPGFRIIRTGLVAAAAVARIVFGGLGF
ncbi:hypothetical protein [Pedobacter sp.]|uniref:hypothetical protein n=1 Tax=Pedobacter sp. TaxID=1411316 RepID=UPI002D1F9C18|nr:hypothetical protein [Pedobacter sp.]